MSDKSTVQYHKLSLYWKQCVYIYRIFCVLQILRIFPIDRHYIIVTKKILYNYNSLILGYIWYTLILVFFSEDYHLLSLLLFFIFII